MSRRHILIWLFGAAPILGASFFPVACKKAAAVDPAASASASGNAGGASSPSAFVAVAPSLASAVPTGSVLGSIQMHTWIYAEPKFGSAKLGYLRAGGIVGRADKPAGTSGCPGGWYAVPPAGYICIGEGATTDLQNPILRATSHRRPDITKPMPYRYAFIRAVAPLYLKTPTKEEQLQYEFKLLPHLAYYSKHADEINAVWPGANDVPEAEREMVLAKPQISPDAALPKHHKAKKDDEDDDDDDDDDDSAAPQLKTDLSELELFGADTAHDKAPWWLPGTGDRTVPHLSTFVAPKGAVIAGRVKRHTGLALIGAYETGPDTLDRKFAITTDLRMVPTSKLKPNVGSQWHGVKLDDNFTLPIAFAYPTEAKKDAKQRKSIKVYTGVESGSAKEDGGTIFFRKAVALTGKDKTIGDTRYFEMKGDDGKGGKWLRKQDIIIARKPDEWPPKDVPLKNGQKWVDIGIIKQTLILWEGEKPVYVTLISTGQDGIGDPKTTKSTPRGTFRIREKHVTATMDANEVGNKFELRDVPWVEYFEAGYALHAAYWHDVYGTPRSHGCVNLSPIDARKVFLWTDPPIPQGWHAVNATEDTGKGTYVHIHI